MLDFFMKLFLSMKLKIQSFQMFLKLKEFFLRYVFTRVGAGVFLALLALKFLLPDSGMKMKDQSQNSQKPQGVKVRIQNLQAINHSRLLYVPGRTKVKNKVHLRAETKGRIIDLGAKEGDRVVQGTPLIKVSLNDRSARLSRAQADVRQRQLAYEAAKKLAQQNFRSQNSVAAEAARLKSAMASLKAIEIELSQTALKAPFSGVIESQFVVVGDYVREGEQIALLVDLDPIMIQGFISEKHLAHIQKGEKAQLTFYDGQKKEAKIHYIASTVTNRTHMYRLELSMPNEKYEFKEGMAVDIHIPLKKQFLHRIPRSSVVLSSENQIGVHVVVKDHAVFYPITIVEDTSKGFWVKGLPHDISLITVGQEWVQNGTLVDVQMDPSSSSLSPKNEEDIKQEISSHELD